MAEYKFQYSKYKLRDYEKNLALLEVRSILGPANYKKTRDLIKVHDAKECSTEELEKLTFFSEIVITNKKRDKIIIPRQVRYELTGKLLKKEDYNHNESFEFITNGISTSRQLRYLTHLMHEYKGRYSPQLCKALMNVAKIRKGELVLDPFVGSGTTLVECFLNGYAGIGIDLNPLSYLVAQTKIESFYLDLAFLKARLQKFVGILSDNSAHKSLKLDDIIAARAFDSSKLDINYLRKWFPIDNLEKIFIILREIHRIKEQKAKHFFLVALSDILRDVSYQDPNQLRIKRRPENEVEKNVFGVYLKKLKLYYRILHTYQFVKPAEVNKSVRSYLGDTRFLRQELKIDENTIDLIVTSPPYATALPYIDTDRLTLFLMGYVSRSNFKQLEKEMIGNREITKKEKERLEEEFINNYSSSDLPLEIRRTIKYIYELNTKSNVGFRRKNTAALLYKYFKDMQQSMAEMIKVLKKGKYCFMVVGCNNTIAGNQNVFIPTDDYIGLIGKSLGFILERKIPLTIQPSYMIHRKNAIKRESVIVFKKS